MEGKEARFFSLGPNDMQISGVRVGGWESEEGEQMLF